MLTTVEALAGKGHYAHAPCAFIIIPAPGENSYDK